MDQFLYNREMRELIKSISSPEVVRTLSDLELEKLVEACRNRIIDVTSKAGGHLASSLGTVELTVALLKIFDLETDRIIWDVGHQGYTYKILTGRDNSFEQIGQRGGIGKFLRREESSYDHFGAGHASTSISAALGMAVGNHLNEKEHQRTIAVIGDGAMTGGLAFEALNNAGHLDQDITVILNDNEMGIDPNVGALSKTIDYINYSKSYNKVREEISSFESGGKIPQAVHKVLKKVNESFMAMFTQGVFFEKLNFRYFGPIDGHNLKELTSILERTKDLKGPLLIHIVTTKGKGYSFAEGDSFTYHGVTAFETISGKFLKKSAEGKSYTAVWSQSFAELMDQDEKVVGTSAAMISNTGLAKMSEKYPNRIFDVGIAEGHAVTFSAGMATQNLKPFVAIYSTFLQRAIDHIIHDVALQDLPVRFMLDRAGYVGADGATHHGAFDLTYLRMIPTLVIMVPKNGTELQKMINTAYHYDDGPSAVRFPRGNTLEYSEQSLQELGTVPIGKGELLRKGKDILLLAVGTMVDQAVELATLLEEKENISCAVINARFVKPLDKELILEWAGKVQGIATMEENVKAGGFGSAVTEVLSEKNVYMPTKLFGMPDQFVEYGSRDDQLKEAGLDEETLYTSLIDFHKSIQK